MILGAPMYYAGITDSNSMEKEILTFVPMLGRQMRKVVAALPIALSVASISRG